jgi:DNA-binding SARP family transcriptional activator
MSIEGLADAVWGGAAPASVSGQVMTAVSVVRRSLREAGFVPDVIETSGAGYRLRESDVRVDAWAAEEKIAAARRAVDQADPAGGALLLRQALDLWRGPVLAGLDGSALLHESARRWDDLRLTAIEEWAELELGLGRHRKLAGDLTAYLVGPLRESLRALLMLALYRSGRRAEALEVYRSGRALLADELGIDPGPELRRLHEAILADDPALGHAAAQRGEADRAAVRPAELPAVSRPFVGRSADLERITWLLTTTPLPIVAIDGPGGIGKSALAIQAAHQVADHFPDGRLYVDLHGFTPGGRPLRPAEVLGRFLRSLGLSDSDIPRGADEAANRFRSLTSGRPPADPARQRPGRRSAPPAAALVPGLRGDRHQQARAWHPRRGGTLAVDHAG